MEEFRDFYNGQETINELFYKTEPVSFSIKSRSIPELKKKLSAFTELYGPPKKMIVKGDLTDKRGDTLFGSAGVELVKLGSKHFVVRYDGKDEMMTPDKDVVVTFST